MDSFRHSLFDVTFLDSIKLGGKMSVRRNINMALTAQWIMSTGKTGVLKQMQQAMQKKLNDVDPSGTYLVSQSNWDQHQFQPPVAVNPEVPDCSTAGLLDYIDGVEKPASFSTLVAAGSPGVVYGAGNTITTSSGDPFTALNVGDSILVYSSSFVGNIGQFHVTVKTGTPSVITVDGVPLTDGTETSATIYGFQKSDGSSDQMRRVLELSFLLSLINSRIGAS